MHISMLFFVQIQEVLYKALGCLTSSNFIRLLVIKIFDSLSTRRKLTARTKNDTFEGHLLKKNELLYIRMIMMNATNI